MRRWRATRCVGSRRSHARRRFRGWIVVFTSTIARAARSSGTESGSSAFWRHNPSKMAMKTCGDVGGRHGRLNRALGPLALEEGDDVVVDGGSHLVQLDAQLRLAQGVQVELREQCPFAREVEVGPQVHIRQRRDVIARADALVGRHDRLARAPASPQGSDPPCSRSSSTPPPSRTPPRPRSRRGSRRGSHEPRRRRRPPRAGVHASAPGDVRGSTARRALPDCLRDPGEALSYQSVCCILVSMQTGLRWPAPIQTVLWGLRQRWFFDHCRRRFGNTFTLRFFGQRTMLVVSESADLKALFSLNAHDFCGGADRAELLEPILGSRSLLFLDGDEHRHFATAASARVPRRAPRRVSRRDRRGGRTRCADVAGRRTVRGPSARVCGHARRHLAGRVRRRCGVARRPAQGARRVSRGHQRLAPRVGAALPARAWAAGRHGRALSASATRCGPNYVPSSRPGRRSARPVAPTC